MFVLSASTDKMLGVTYCQSEAFIVAQDLPLTLWTHGTPSELSPSRTYVELQLH